MISIHSPRVGRDHVTLSPSSQRSPFQSTLPVLGETTGACFPCPKGRNFNPLSPCWERRVGFQIATSVTQFQSTLPVLGETSPARPAWPVPADFNPLSPCWERHSRVRARRFDGDISIHSPRVGRDHDINPRLIIPTYFNPLSPCGERRPCRDVCYDLGAFQSTLPVWGETLTRAFTAAGC